MKTDPQTGEEAGADVIVTGRTEEDFSRDRFQEADSAVSRSVRGGSVDSKSIETVLDKVNNQVLREAAKVKTPSQFERKILVFWWTLIGKSAEDVVDEYQGNVNEIAGLSEGNLRGINGKIVSSCKKAETLQAKVSKLSHDVDTYEYALRGYDFQIAEIGSIFTAYQNGQTPSQAVTLKVLPPEYLTMGMSRLERERAVIETKKRTAEIELTRLYAILSTEGRKLDSTHVATARLIGQYKKAMGTHVGALNRQTLLLPEGYVDSIKTQVQISATNEKLEKSIKTRDKVAGAFYQGVEENLETLTGSFEPDFGSDDDIQRSKGTIDERFKEMGQEGEVNFESLRDIAHSYSVKYGH